MIKVFTYGTLMKNGYNHNYYLSGQKFLGSALLPGYALYNLGSYPGIIPDDRGQVLGELYEIDLPTLNRLDLLEANGTLYIRQTLIVIRGDEEVNAQVYIWKGEVNPLDKIELCDQPWSGINRKGANF